jgi:hypothetical protein
MKYDEENKYEEGDAFEKCETFGRVIRDAYLLFNTIYGKDPNILERNPSKSVSIYNALKNDSNYHLKYNEILEGLKKYESESSGEVKKYISGLRDGLEKGWSKLEEIAGRYEGKIEKGGSAYKRNCHI